MEVINVPFVKIEDDETCALLKPADGIARRPPVQVVVDEIMKVLTIYPEVKERVKLRLAKGN